MTLTTARATSTDPYLATLRYDRFGRVLMDETFTGTTTDGIFNGNILVESGGRLAGTFDVQANTLTTATGEGNF